MKDLNPDKKPDKKPGLSEKFKAMDKARKDKLATRVITIAVAAVILVYAAVTMLPDRAEKQPGDDSQDRLVTDVPGDASQDAQEGLIPGEYQSGQDAVTAPDDDNDGNTDAPAPGTQTDEYGYAYTGGQTLYAAYPDGTRMFEFHVPIGYMTMGANNGTWVKPEGLDLSVQSSDPILFTWSKPAGADELFENGFYDLLQGQAGGELVSKTFEAIDYYISETLDRSEMPVVLARLSVRYSEDSEYGEDLDEYYILANCGQPLMFCGRVDSYGLNMMSSQRYPDFASLARAMLVPVSEPGSPATWTTPVEPGPEPEPEPAQDGNITEG